LDASSSVTQYNFPLVLKFVERIVKQYKISQTQVRVSVVLFSTNVCSYFQLSLYSSKADILERIKSLEYWGGSSATGFALHFTLTNILNEVRHGVSSTVILVTDGQSNDNNGFHPIQEAKVIKNGGTNIVVVGITEEVNQDELNSISSSGKFIYIQSFKSLPEFAGSVSKEVCEVQDDNDSY